MRLRFIVPFALTIAAILVAPGNADASGGASDPGWQALWRNDADAAESAFRARLRTDNQDLDAQRGLILALFCRGQERTIVKELEALSRMKGADATDFLLTMWLYRLVATSGPDEKTFQSSLQRLASHASIGPLDRRPILDAGSLFALDNGDAGSTREVTKKLGRLGEWWVLGPFDNTSGSGHGKNYLGSDGMNLLKQYEGKAGIRFAWRKLRVLDLENCVRFGNHFEHSTGMTGYAATVFDLDAPATLVLSVRRTGALAVTVDSHLLMNDETRATRRELEHFEIDFPAGRHSILLKSSHDQQAPEVAVSLSTPDGRPAVVKPVTLIASLPTDVVVDELAFRPVPLAMVSQIDALVGADSLDAGAAFWQLVACVNFGLGEKGRAAAGLAAQRFPDSGLIRHACANALRIADDEDGERSHMQHIVDASPRYMPAVVWAASEKSRRGRDSEAEATLKSALAGKKEFVTADLLLMELFVKRGMQEEAVRSARAFEKTYPGFSRPLQVLANYYEAAGDPGQAKKYRRATIAAVPKTAKIFLEWAKQLEQDDPTEQSRQLQALIELFPDWVELRTQLAFTKIEMGDAAAALALADEGVLLFPSRSGPQLLKAQIEDLRAAVDPSRKELAIKHYEAAFALDPTHLQARDRLRQLKGLTPVSEILPRIDLEAARRNAPTAEDHPGQGACVLLDQRRRIVFEDGTSYWERALVVKILSASGVEQFGSIHTGVNPLIVDLVIKEARTLKPDGQALEAEELSGKVAFQALAPGDIVELYYGVSVATTGRLNRDFWDSHIFQWSVPCKVSTYELLTPADAWFASKLHNCELPESEVLAKRKLKDGFTRYTWQLTDIPARAAEAAPPAPRDVSPWLDVSSVATWGEIAAWYSELSDGPSKSDSNVRSKVRELLPEEKERDVAIRRLSSFVTNEVVYEDLDFQYSAFVPQRASAVLRSLYGDCKDKVCLLRSMLYEAGVGSRFALVTPLDDGSTPFLPSPRFSHAILAIIDGSDTTFVDPTATGFPLGLIPIELEGAPALIVDESSSALVRVRSTTRDDDATRVDTRVAIEASGRMRIERNEVYRAGDEIGRLRHALGDVSDDERKQYLLASLGKSLTGVEFSRSEWHGLEHGADSIRVAYDVNVPEAVAPSGSLCIARLPWRSDVGRDFGALVAPTNRQLPLELHGIRIYEEEELHLGLPKGWSLTTVPESIDMNTPFGKFVVRYERAGTGLRAHRVLRAGGCTVPASDYPSFKRFLETAIRQQETVLVMQGTVTR
jgi:tetratricopeptide (TPR) repeat protein